MDNLINFEEENSAKESNSNIENLLSQPLLVTGRPSVDANSNPFDKFEYRSLHIGDPFDILELKKEVEAELSNISTTSSNAEKRCQSDSSVSSALAEKDPRRERFNSVDNIQNKKLNNSLLKLSLLNSPLSPLHSSSVLSMNSLPDSVLQEARMIAERLANNRDLSFEDINNISQQLIETSQTNISLTDSDLEQLKISFLESNPLSTPPKLNATPPRVKAEVSGEKISNIQETLKRIKKEDVEDDDDVVIKVEDESPEKEQKGIIETKSEVEVDNILQKIKSLVKSNNRDDARKELQRLNEILNEKPKSTLQTPSRYVRQDTFDIDPETGNRVYCQNGDGDNSNGDLMEQLAKLFGTHSLDVNTLNISGGNGVGETKVVVIMPPKSLSPTAATPIKIGNPVRRSVSMSSTKKPPSALQALENKKLSTPMKKTLTPAPASHRRTSFAPPKSVPKNPPSRPIEQKSNFGGVRKSLMPSMDNTPSRPQRKPSPARSSSSNLVRRSSSLKEKTPSSSIPTVNVTTPTPTKQRPVTSYATPSKIVAQNSARAPLASSIKRLSTAPTSTRPAPPSAPPSRLSTTAQKSSTLNNSRPSLTRKTEFKTPYATASKKPSTAKGSLV